jgi:hypothetical protein
MHAFKKPDICMPPSERVALNVALASCRAAVASPLRRHGCRAWRARSPFMGRCCKAATVQPQTQRLQLLLPRLQSVHTEPRIAAAVQQVPHH